MEMKPCSTTESVFLNVNNRNFDAWLTVVDIAQSMLDWVLNTVRVSIWDTSKQRKKLCTDTIETENNEE